MNYTFQDTDEHFSDPTNCEQAEKAMRRYEKAVRLIYDLNKGRQEGRGFKVTDRDRDDRASALRALEAEIGEWAASMVCRGLQYTLFLEEDYRNRPVSSNSQIKDGDPVRRTIDPLWN